jgi:biopolymer transport protein ExbB/TolQ
MDIGGSISVLLDKGGFAAYPILFCGFVMAVIGLERLMSLFFRYSFNTEAALEGVRAQVLERKYTQALQVCNGKPNAPDLSVVKAGLIAVETGREAMKSSLSAAVLGVSHKVEARLQYLALIANVSTLLGLMGTIFGLIKTFDAIGKADAAEKARLLGEGISEAMYATGAGLIVGVIAMVVHTVCTTKADAIIGQAQDAGLKLMTWVEQSERSTHAG